MYNQTHISFTSKTANGYEMALCAYFFIAMVTYMLTITHTGGSRIL